MRGPVFNKEVTYYHPTVCAALGDSSVVSIVAAVGSVGVEDLGGAAPSSGRRRTQRGIDEIKSGFLPGSGVHSSVDPDGSPLRVIPGVSLDVGVFSVC